MKMKTISLFLALPLLLIACGDKPYEGTEPIEFRIKICSNTLAAAESASTAATDKEICGEEVEIIRGQLNPSKAYHCDDGCAKDEYADMAVWNNVGPNVRLYVWKNAIGLSVFDRDYVEVRNAANYDQVEGYHPNHDYNMGMIHEDDTIYAKACVMSNSWDGTQEVCSEITHFKVSDGR